MKNILLLFMSLVFIICLVGCSGKKKCTIDFIINGKSYSVKIDKGASISEDIIPLSNDQEVVELYYDEKMIVYYNNEPVEEDLKIYVNKMSKDLYLMITNAKNDFLEQYNGKLFTKKCYGLFENSVFFFIHGDAFDVSDPKPVYLAMTTIYIYGFPFSYKHSFSILMYKEGEFYDLSNYLTLGKIMDDKLLSPETAQKMYNKHLEFFS